MSDVQIAVTAEELEAEVIRSRLEAEGIPARIAPRSRIGYPAAWSPSGLGFGIGSFEVRVPNEHARVARRIVGDVEPERSPAPLIVRVVSSIVLLYLLTLMALSLGMWWSQLF